MGWGRVGWVVLGVVVVSGGLAGCAPQPGPFAGMPEHGSGVVAEVGGTVTDGASVLWLRGDGSGSQPFDGHDVVVERIEAVYADDAALETVDVQISGPTRETFQYWTGGVADSPFELVDPQPVEGAVLAWGADGRELFIETRVTAAGKHERTGFIVHSSVDGVEYADYVPAVLLVCTPEATDADGFCVED